MPALTRARARRPPIKLEGDLATGIDPEQAKALQRLRALSALQLKASSERLEAELQQVDLEASSDVSILSDEGRTIRPLEEKLAKLERQKEAARSVFRPEYPGLVDLESQIDSAERELRQHRKNLVESVRRESRENLDAAIEREDRTAAEASRMLGLTVLGVVPDCRVQPQMHYVRKRWVQGKKKGHPWQLFENRTKKAPAIELLPFHQPLHPVAEAYRTLASGLLGLGGNAPRTLAITSARPGEGKTATTANLGVVMAQFGRRILIVDGDLRKPRLAKVFDTDNSVGLVQVLAGTSSLAKAIQPTEIPGLSLLPAGKSMNEPWKLLASQRMTELVALLGEQFDLVLIDSPPLLAVTDPTLLGARVDGVALCLRSGKVRREEVRACADRLEMADGNIIGIVLNGYVPAASGYGNYSYYYQTYGDQADLRNSRRGA